MGPKKELQKYDLNDKILCRHGLFYYEAKITEVAEEDGEPVYVVHYQGWHKRYDERILHSETAEKFLEFTPENVARCKKEIQEASASKAKKRKTKDSNDDDSRKSDAGSRASTPVGVPRSGSVSTTLRSKIAKKRAEAGSDAPAATSTTSSVEPESKLPAHEPRDPILLQELEKLNTLPCCLLQIIVDDSDIMTRQRMVSRLPARFTVDMIIDDYCAEVGFSPKDGDDCAVADTPAGLGSSAIGLKDFFNSVFGYQLLYKFERPQYAAEIEKVVGSADMAIRKRKSQSSQEDINNILIPSKLYGLPHLLRLIVRLAKLLRDVPWNDTVFRDIIKCTHHMVGFLERNHQKYYSIENDYENTTPEYQKTAWASTS
ncbi:unnamed protein product [Nippostrongylus brasiliensis]|uniref:MRG domain-containing protein n=1 Tax=Nippostrongylus brasiliensis TaxID=27835 RepID=A0A158R2A4_NIPBR|nr:hypothetical protein Q1695_004290 [Nippostrongylus brasiliensis]VDL78977.1 unnamed protein product [Nippostrongylus brasiliensis]